MTEAWVEEHGKKLYGLCLKLERHPHKAEELYQETWLRALRYQNRYNEKEPFYPWIARICVNTWKNLLRRRKLESVFRDFTQSEALNPGAGTEATRDADPFEHESLERALSELDSKHRLVVVLHYYEDLSIAKTAGILGLREGTVKSRLHHARQKLRRCLEDAKNE